MTINVTAAADTSAADAARAHAVLNTGNQPKFVAAVLNAARALFLEMRVGQYDGPALSRFDSTWDVQMANRPRPEADAALGYANTVLDYYRAAKRAASEAEEFRAELMARNRAESDAERRGLPARLGFANAHLKPLTKAAAFLESALAAITATKPTLPIMTMQQLVEVGNEAELAVLLDALDADLARVTSVIAGMRADMAARS